MRTVPWERDGRQVQIAGVETDEDAGCGRGWRASVDRSIAMSGFGFTWGADEARRARCDGRAQLAGLVVCAGFFSFFAVWGLLSARSRRPVGRPVCRGLAAVLSCLALQRAKECFSGVDVGVVPKCGNQEATRGSGVAGAPGAI